MKPPLAVVDTNVVVSGLISNTPESPTCAVLDGMLSGRFPFLLSVELMVEYRRVLLRPRIRDVHGLDVDEIDVILEQVVTNGIILEPPEFSGSIPDKGDRHLWALLAVRTAAILIIGDRALIKNPPTESQVLSPRAFVILLNA